MTVLVRALKELHQPEERDGYDIVKRGFVRVTVCGYCANLCHSHSGLKCEMPPDAIWPCDTMQIVERVGV